MARKILSEKDLKKADSGWLAKELLGVDKRIDNLYTRSERIRSFYRPGLTRGLGQYLLGIKNTISNILIKHNKEIEDLEKYLELVAGEVQNRGLDTPLFAEHYGLQGFLEDFYSFEL